MAWCKPDVSPVIDNAVLHEAIYMYEIHCYLYLGNHDTNLTHWGPVQNILSLKIENIITNVLHIVIDMIWVYWCSDVIEDWGD